MWSLLGNTNKLCRDKYIFPWVQSFQTLLTGTSKQIVLYLYNKFLSRLKFKSDGDDDTLPELEIL